jgi:phage FluMu protein gp41
MEALFQIGKELSEMRSRVEALELTAGDHFDARSSSELLSEYPS